MYMLNISSLGNVVVISG